MSRRQIVLGILVISLLAAGVAFGASVKVGQKAPNFKLANLQGKQVSLSNYKGQGVVLNFWATWCGPCRQELPDFQKEHRTGKKFKVVTVNLRENKKTVQDFMKRGKYTFPVLLDSKGTVSKSYGVKAVPTTIFIDKNGIVREVVVGTLTGAQLRQKIRKHFE